MELTSIRSPILRNGVLWEVMGLVVLFGTPAAIGFFFDCDPIENCGRQVPGILGQLLVMLPIFAILIGGGLYLVGIAHSLLAPAPWWRRVAGIMLRLVGIGLPLLVLVGVAVGDS